MSLAERAVELRHLVGRGGRHLGDLVFGGALVAVHRRLQRLALARSGSSSAARSARTPRNASRAGCGQRELRLGGQVVRAIRALRARLRIGLDDLAIPVVALPTSPALPRDSPRAAGAPPSHRASGVGLAATNFSSIADGLRRVVGLRVQVRRLQQRLALHGLRPRPGSPRCARTPRPPRPGDCRFAVGHRELARHVRLRSRSWELAPEALEHADGAVPLLEIDELRGRVVLRRWRGSSTSGATRATRRKSSTAPRAVAGLLLRLALLVDGGREALGEVGAHLVVAAGADRAPAGRRAPPCRTRPGRSATAR